MYNSCAVYPCVPLCTPVYPCVPLCTPVYPCVPLCTPVYPCVPLCIPVYPCVPLCTPVYPCVSLCTPVYPYGSQCTPVYPCEPLCTSVYHVCAHVYLSGIRCVCCGHPCCPFISALTSGWRGVVRGCGEAFREKGIFKGLHRTAPFWRSAGAWQAGANVAALTALLRILENEKNNLPRFFSFSSFRKNGLKKTLSRKLPNSESAWR